MFSYFDKDKAALISIRVIAFALLLLSLFLTATSMSLKNIVRAQVSSLEEQQEQSSTDNRGGVGELSINTSVDGASTDEVINQNTVTTGSFGDDRIIGSNTSDTVIASIRCQYHTW
jgi:hypothetical protein